jgi:hypothetical protein
MTLLEEGLVPAPAFPSKEMNPTQCALKFADSGSTLLTPEISKAPVKIIQNDFSLQPTSTWSLLQHKSSFVCCNAGIVILARHLLCRCTEPANTQLIRPTVTTQLYAPSIAGPTLTATAPLKAHYEQQFISFIRILRLFYVHWTSALYNDPDKLLLLHDNYQASSCFVKLEHESITSHSQSIDPHCNPVRTHGLKRGEQRSFAGGHLATLKQV